MMIGTVRLSIQLLLFLFICELDRVANRTLVPIICFLWTQASLSPVLTLSWGSAHWKEERHEGWSYIQERATGNKSLRVRPWLPRDNTQASLIKVLMCLRVSSQGSLSVGANIKRKELVLRPHGSYSLSLYIFSHFHIGVILVWK